MPHQPPASNAMATMGDEQQPRTSIANLILPPGDIRAENLLSLSNLAAAMTPAQTTRKNFNRTKSVPAVRKTQDPLPDDTRRNHRMSRTTSVAAPLGVAHAQTKRLSRRGSGLSGLSNVARNAIASTSGLVSGESSSEPPGTPRAAPGIATNTLPSPTPSPAVLRPINSNPITGYQSKHTSASNSIESCVPDPRSPIKSEAFHAAASRFQPGFAATALARMREDPMDCDAEQREPSSSSHDAKIVRQGSRSRTTPDAKRAQNRESAKRFRVAQKKRWAELQETVEKKDEEIEKLKSMLQEVTNNTLARRATDEGPSMQQHHTVAANALDVAELGLFVKLMKSPPEEKKGTPGNEEKRMSAPLAANIGALYRVVVCKTDGCVLGVRHHTSRGREAMGGQVGSLVWEHVESSDVPHLRFSIVHAPKMAEYNNGEPHVFSYKRREIAEDRDTEKWMRMKGCVYPTHGEDGEISGVLLAEFIEL